MNIFTVSSPMSPVSPISPVSLMSSVSWDIDDSDAFANSILSPFNPNSPIYANVPLKTRYSVSSNVNSADFDALIDSPVLASLNLSYNKPAFGYYQNMNADPELHERMVKHFYYFKTLGEWLYDDYLSLLNYLVLDKKTKKIRLIKRLKDLNQSSVDKDSKKIIESKIKYIKEKVLSENDMMYILNHIVRKAKINWYDLPHREDVVKTAIKRFIKNKMEKKISGQ
jgi:hypothetical protein